MCECVESETKEGLTMRIPALLLTVMLCVCCSTTVLAAPVTLSVSADRGSYQNVTTTEPSAAAATGIQDFDVSNAVDSLPLPQLTSLAPKTPITDPTEKMPKATTRLLTNERPKNYTTGASPMTAAMTTTLPVTTTKDSLPKPKSTATTTSIPTSSTVTDVSHDSKQSTTAQTLSTSHITTAKDTDIMPERTTVQGTSITATATTRPKAQAPSTTHVTSSVNENSTTLTVPTPRDILTDVIVTQEETTVASSLMNISENKLMYPVTADTPNETITGYDDDNDTVSITDAGESSVATIGDMVGDTTVTVDSTIADVTAGTSHSSGDIWTNSDAGKDILSQSAALNVTTFNVKVNSTIPFNTTIQLFTTKQTTADDLTTQTSKIAVPPHTSDQTTTPLVPDPTTASQTSGPKATAETSEPTGKSVISDKHTPVPPPGDGSTSDKGVGAEKSDEPQSLTIILIVICASLLVILLVLCVFTYVKFRKKSRSIRKRLTFKDDAIYENPIYHGRWDVPKAPEPTSSSCPRSLPMLISALPDEVARLSKDDDTGFRLQFMMLDKLSPSSPNQAATTDANTNKNRYRDILPFDFNRVKLSEEGDKSDYINASFVPGVKSEREYVTSQGPLERTAADHWRMIWELNIRVIAMLTTCEEGDLIFKAKCCQYWPNKENDSVNYGGIYVTLVSTARLCRDNYKLKVLHIRQGKDSEPRKVQLFQYIKWPDRKNPEDPEAFLEYRNHVHREGSMSDEQHPILVHCSAGVGRTGTFIAIDTLLQHMEERESIDVYGLVLRLRKYRVLLVQNASQYKFVHTCLLIVLDKIKKAEIDEGRKKAGDEGSPYENMVMGQRAVVGELGGLVHGDESGVPLQQSSAVQNFLRKTKTNVEPVTVIDDQPSPNSEGMPSPVKVEEWPRPLSDPVPRPVIETPKESRPFSPVNKGDPGRALAKELGGMFHVGVDPHASPGKTAAIKAFLRNRDLDADTTRTAHADSQNGDSLVIDNRFREDNTKQTTCL